MAKGIAFDRESGHRIARSVRRTEAEHRTLVGQRRPPGQILSVPVGGKHWGTLAAALDYDDTVGVTVNLDIGGTIENVLPSKTQSDTIDSGSAVLIELIDGDWYVTLAPC